MYQIRSNPLILDNNIYIIEINVMEYFKPGE